MTKDELIKIIESLGQAFLDQARILALQAVQTSPIDEEVLVVARKSAATYKQYKTLVPLVTGMISQLTDEQIAAVMSQETL